MKSSQHIDHEPPSSSFSPLSKRMLPPNRPPPFSNTTNTSPNRMALVNDKLQLQYGQSQYPSPQTELANKLEVSACLDPDRIHQTNSIFFAKHMPPCSPLGGQSTRKRSISYGTVSESSSTPSAPYSSSYNGVASTEHPCTMIKHDGVVADTFEPAVVESEQLQNQSLQDLIVSSTAFSDPLLESSSNSDKSTPSNDGHDLQSFTRSLFAIRDRDRRSSVSGGIDSSRKLVKSKARDRLDSIRENLSPDSLFQRPRSGSDPAVSITNNSINSSNVREVFESTFILDAATEIVVTPGKAATEPHCKKMGRFSELNRCRSMVNLSNSSFTKEESNGPDSNGEDSFNVEEADEPAEPPLHGSRRKCSVYAGAPDPKGDTSLSLIGDCSRHFLLRNQCKESRWYASPNDIADLLEGVYQVKRVYVIDCRDSYEYEGAHIKGAINIKDHDFSALKNMFFGNESSPPKIKCDPAFCGNEEASPSSDASREIFVFHCEFSSHRGPAMFSRFRDIDRQIHLEKGYYPKLYYPEAYIISGGYKAFAKYCYDAQREHLCVGEHRPPNYVKQKSCDRPKSGAEATRRFATRMNRSKTMGDIEESLSGSPSTARSKAAPNSGTPKFNMNSSLVGAESTTTRLMNMNCSLNLSQADTTSSSLVANDSRSSNQADPGAPAGSSTPPMQGVTKRVPNLKAAFGPHAGSDSLEFL